MSATLHRLPAWVQRSVADSRRQNAAMEQPASAGEGETVTVTLPRTSPAHARMRLEDVAGAMAEVLVELATDVRVVPEIRLRAAEAALNRVGVMVIRRPKQYAPPPRPPEKVRPKR